MNIATATLRPEANARQSPESLLRAFQTKKAKIAVIGLGYVGLPLSIAASSAGLVVLGFDIDAQKIEALARGESYFKHIPGAFVRQLVDEGRFEATADFARLGEVDAILICVPTPLTRHHEPDLSYVEATARAVASHLKRGHLVVLESTTYPGTTRDVVRPILEAGGMVCGEDFFLAFSPEREDPGNPSFSTSRIPKIVGGEGAIARDLANALYASFVDETVPVSSTATAEAVKLTENIFRSVNIALVNELKIIFSTMGIDIWEVIDAAKTKPFGFMPFYPGPGLGGHCIPIDPFYLTWKAKEFELSTRFIELAGQINLGMPAFVVAKLTEALDQQQKKGLNGSRILILGLAYKKNIDDLRETPALKLISLMEKRGAEVDYHDPHIPVVPLTREHAEVAGRRSAPFSATSIAGYDGIVIVTDHDAVDYGLLVANARLIVDTRNVCRRAGFDGPHVVPA
jgi:UDP-N-acetyl-D-glucosamine dehydrogenase